MDLAVDTPFRFRLYSASGSSAARGRRLQVTGASLAGGDLLAGCVAMALLAVTGVPMTPAGGALVALGALAVSAFDGAYGCHTLRLRRYVTQEARGLLHVGVVTALLLALSSQDIAPLEVIAGGALALAAIALVRGLLYRAIRSRAAAQRCILVAQPSRFAALRRQLDIAGVGVDVVSQVDISALGPTALHRHTIEELIAVHDADRVIVAADGAIAQAAETTRSARRAGVTVTVLPPAVDALGPNLVPELVGGNVALSAGRSELTSWDERLKRGFDFAGAAVLVVLFAPFMALVACAIKLTSPGPVLFWQERVGRDGRPFRIAKFRTMVEDAEGLKAALRHVNEAEGIFKIVDDPRITPVGRLLRKAALDELPQLLNVLRGEMSLVGPRPLVGEEDVNISGWHRERLRLAPGMTGPWQVMGSARIGLQEMVLLDHHYVSNWSIWSDLQMLLRTVGFVLSRQGM